VVASSGAQIKERRDSHRYMGSSSVSRTGRFFLGGWHCLPQIMLFIHRPLAPPRDDNNGGYGWIMFMFYA
jgi:hypothetical protein